MEKEKVNQIIETWQEMADSAHAHYDGILCQDDVLSLQVKDLQELVTYSREFVAKMEDLFCDFRHLIGMSDILVTDRSKLTSIFKEISAFRSDAKRLMSISDIMSVGFKPVASDYTLKLNPSIKLISHPRAGQTYRVSCMSDEDFANCLDHVTFITDQYGKLILKVKLEDIVYARAILCYGNGCPQDDYTKDLNKFIGKLDAGSAFGCDVAKQKDEYIITITEDGKPMQIYKTLVAKLHVKPQSTFLTQTIEL